ncbi:hypothetical protein DL764_007148 [Monosporascus ibericus]|uniref:DNA 3'-5' helicase n=1 Tax=Monosporascus ibericus TaxID=155417 RepID=A0A4Q4T631_9PEZI|nr:hypothetical protein DL764_007148 [Monosporascus ibericus]
MSGESSQAGTGNSHIYGFPNRRPRFLPLEDLNVQGGEILDPLDEDQVDDRHLDDFGRLQQSNSLDCLPSSSSNPPSRHDGHETRVSLSLSKNPSHPARALGDASHHFRPFAPRDPDYQSAFTTNPIHMDKLRPSPASQPIFGRYRSQKAKEFQLSTQLATPPYCIPSNKTTPRGSSITQSSSSELGNSSPSMRLSLKRPPQKATQPPASQAWGDKLQLDLDHARNIPPIINNTQLVDPRQALPDRFRAIFPYQLFNAVQSKCLPVVYGTNENVVISAPTGSGKTAILELAICKLVGSPGGENFKIVYQAPTKSLCAERARDWEKKFSHMNLRCIELTGDTSQAQARLVGSASIIVTTPEKWDSVTRKWSDHRKLLDMVRLVLIDEVHILNDTRGATLEAVVSRMKTIRADVRFVAISATVPNIQDIAKWLGRDATNQHEPAKHEAFDEKLRPVKLRKYVYGYDGSPNEFIFEKSLDGKLNLLLSKHSEKKPIMIFCFTRKSCESTAKVLAEWWSACNTADKAWPAPSKRIPVISRDLQEIVRHGVAFHHAGLGLEDRVAVEQHYLSGQLHVICCTSTLAVGVNLPCHTVVLKGTMGYSDGELQEYSDLEVMQMLGRAGRPQFDKSAVAIIITRREKVNRYNMMIKGEQTLESTLHRNLVEHLNSEIGLGTIQDIATAKKWISGTFLSVRMRQEPGRYGAEDVISAGGADERMGEWCERDIKSLQQYSLITQAPFGCTEYGNAMSRYMVRFETMKLLLTMPRGVNLEEMLTTLSKAEEFRDFRFKPAERALFRTLNQSPFILHPIRETPTQTWHKVSLMVQVYVGGVELPNDKEFGQLKRQIGCEKTAIFDRLNRLVRCVIDCKAYDGDGVGTRVGLELARAIAANSWENKPTQLSQIPGFGPVAVRRWVGHGVRTVISIADKDFLEIERIASRNPPYGKNLLKTLNGFPRLTLGVEMTDSPRRQFGSQNGTTVMVKASLGHCNTNCAPSWNGKAPAVTFMAEVSDGSLAYFWRGNIKTLDTAQGLDLRFPVALSGPDQVISCYFSCEEIVGTEVMKTLEPQISGSAFNSISVPRPRRELPKVDLLDSDLDIDDADMVDAMDSAVLNGGRLQSNENASTVDAVNDEYPFIDDLLSQGPLPPTAEPQKMENGKWMCHHHCRNGAPTKSGKPCSHKCCHEGVDKPRRPPQRKETKEAGEEDADEDRSVDTPKARHEMHRGTTARDIQAKDLKPAKSKSSVTNRGGNSGSQTERRPSQSKPQTEYANPIRPNLKRTRSIANAVVSSYSRERGMANRETPVADLPRDVDCIDLSIESDNDGIHKLSNAHKKLTTETEKGRNRLLKLHRKSQRDTTNPARLTKSYNNKAPRREGTHSRDPARSFVDTLAANDGNEDTHYDGDSLADDDEFPDIDKLIGLTGNREAESSQRMTGNDETLYPGTFYTLKESMGYEREYLPSYDGLEAWDTLDVLMSSTHHEDQPLFFDSDPLLVDMDPEHTASTQPEQDDPAWLSEFDPQLIESLRCDSIRFVD